MIKRNFIRTLAVALALGMLAAGARGADLKDAKQIIKKSEAYALSIDSYSYLVKGEGWDLNAAETAKRTSVVAGEASQKFGAVKDLAGDIKKDADNDKGKSEPVFKRYKVLYKFKKPYLLQMNVIMSEYVPKIIYGSLMTYRPDNDPEVFWFKPKISPMAIKRPINSESGDMLYAVMSLNYAMIEAMSKDAKPVFKGIAKVNDRDAYKVEFVFDMEKKKHKPYAVNFKKFGIPKEAQKKYEDEVNGYENDPTKSVMFYFDKETLLITQRETFDEEGKLLGRKIWSDIKVNELTEKDF